ncbi:PAS domain S-box protein [Uliginosibacterium sediminicola]|uniref:Oxygen sensor histidine kinase NreB n=1 Tax=Uliginosibacterium sediminicola TaxID=2024550 RepID=A0ABU9YV89_9RHOO
MKPYDKPEHTPPLADTADTLKHELARCRSELAQARAQAKAMADVFMHLADATFIVERDATIIDANPAACALLGYSREALLHMYPWDFVISASREEILTLTQGLQPGEVATVQRVYRRHDQEQLLIDLRLIRCNLGGRDLIMVSCRDVTARERASEALSRSENHQRQLLDSIPGLVWSAKATGEVEYHNNRWTDYTGLTVEQANGWGWQSAIYPDDLPKLVSQWQTLLATGSAGEGEARLRRHDGVYRWYLFRGVPVRDDAGKLIGWFGMNTDIEDRKWAESLLAAEKRVLEMIAQGMALSDVFAAICLAADEMSADTCSLILDFEAGSRSARSAIAPGFGLTSESVPPPTHWLPPDALLQHICDSKLPVVVGKLAQADLQADQVWRERLLQSGFQACWLSPILSSVGTALGAFVMYSRLAGEPGLQHGKMIEQITHLAAIAIERRCAAEALRAAGQLARGQVEALTHTVDALAIESEPERIAEHVLRTITSQLGALGCSLWRREEDSGLVAFAFAFEHGRIVMPSDPKVGPVSPALRIEDVWPWPEVFRTGKPYLLEDIREDLRFPWRDHVLALGVISILIVPMLVAGEVEGVIGIRFSARRTFSTDETDLAQALANLAMLALQLTRLSVQNRSAAVLAERNRMARDIHDTLAQGFTGVIVQLEAAADASAKALNDEAKAHMLRAAELARDSLKEARRSVQALRPQALQDKTLCEALGSLVHTMTQGTALKAVFSVEGKLASLPAEWEENLLRIGQEVLTNTLRHAQAQQFSVQLAFAPSALKLTLQDDGKGFDARSKHDGFGLLGIRERVTGMGGQVSIHSQAGAGTTIHVTLPYLAAEHSAERTPQ